MKFEWKQGEGKDNVKMFCKINIEMDKCLHILKYIISSTSTSVGFRISQCFLAFEKGDKWWKEKENMVFWNILGATNTYAFQARRF